MFEKLGQIKIRYLNYDAIWSSSDNKIIFHYPETFISISTNGFKV